MTKTKENTKLSDKYNRRKTITTEGRRVTAARIDRIYRMVLPVTLSQTIAYDAPDQQQTRQSKTKNSAFDQMLQEQIKGQEMEANQTFQLYC